MVTSGLILSQQLTEEVEQISLSQVLVTTVLKGKGCTQSRDKGMVYPAIASGNLENIFTENETQVNSK